MQENRQLNLILKLKDEASKELGNFQGKLKGLQPTFQKMAAGGAIAFTAIATAVGASVREFAKFEQAEIAFESMLGSAEEATKMIERLSEFSAKTPFQFEDIVQATRTLVAFGSSGEEATERLKFLGDISAGAQVPLSDLAQIFGKVQTKGKAMTEEILQMSERGIPIIDALAEQFDVTKGAIFEMAETGQLSADIVEQALIGMTEDGAIFANQMQKQSESVAGLFSTLKDNLSLLMAEVGKIFEEDAKKLLRFLTEVLGRVKEWISENPKLTKWIIIVAASIAALVTVIGTLGIALFAITTALGVISSVAIPAFLVALAPISIALLTLVALAWYLNKNWQDVWAGMQIVTGEVANTMMSIFEGVVNFFIGGINSMLETVNKILRRLSRIPRLGKQFEGMQIDLIKPIELERYDTGFIYQEAINRKDTRSGTDILGEKMGNFITPDYGYAQAQEVTNVNINGGFFGSDAGEELGDQIIKQLQLNNKL